MVKICSPATSGLRGRRRTYLTILELAEHALFKMVKYVLLCLLRPELVGQDVEASSCEGRRVSNSQMNGSNGMYCLAFSVLHLAHIHNLYRTV
jgi:hypothetical protein